MDDQTAILANAMQEDPFEIVMRGYNRRQVDEYVARIQAHVRDLEVRLTRALGAVEQSRRDLADAQTQPANRQPHEEVSDRLLEILRLAAEEAEQARAQARADATQMRATAEQEIGTVVQEAREEADQILSAARAEADRGLQQAHQDAQRLVDSSRAEAERVVGDATDHAERLRRQAEQRSSVVNGVLNDRVATLDQAHMAAVRRLTEIGQTITELLRGENDAGPLAAALEVGEEPDPAQAPPRSEAESYQSPDTAELPAQDLPSRPTEEILALDDEPAIEPDDRASWTDEQGEPDAEAAPRPEGQDDVVIDLTEMERARLGRHR